MTTPLSRFLAARKSRSALRALAGRIGRCPECGRKNPAGVTRRCSRCRQKFLEENEYADVLGFWSHP
jgi:DNA-directed RNA polymerase subunit RPC12/RpoP